MIRLLDTEKDLQAYEKLCRVQNASVFNSVKWLNIYFPKLDLYGIFNDNNELIGSFYFFKGKKYGQEFNICPPFTPHNGLFFENPAENSANINSFNKKIIEEVAAFIEELGSKLIVFVLPATVAETQPFTWKQLKVSVKYTYHIDLASTESQLLANLSSEKRKSLNKAEKDTISVEKCSDMKAVREVIFKTFARKEINKNLGYFDKVLFQFADVNNSFAFLAKDNGRPIAASFCVYDNSTAYYLFGGYDPENRHHGAGVTCMWKSILYAKNQGLKTFDFEGSMIPEVERYFREFGGKLIPYYEVSRAQFPVNLLMKR